MLCEEVSQRFRSRVRGFVSRSFLEFAADGLESKQEPKPPSRLNPKRSKPDMLPELQPLRDTKPFGS